MYRYVGKRLWMALLTIFIVASVTFFAMNLVPGGPFTSEKALSPEAQAALEEKYGLDKPLFEQYVRYLKNVLSGDFGESIKQRGRSVLSIIMSKFPVSATLGGLAVVFALAIGIPLGILAATKRGTWIDYTILIAATGGIAIPSFVVCSLLLYFFGVKFQMLPTYGLENFWNYVMPVTALAFYPAAYVTRLIRNSMMDVLGQDYMRTAKAKGVSPRMLLFKHALRNAILPVVTYVGPLLAYTITGSFIVEKIFTIPGLGGEFVGAVTGRDYPVIMGTTIFLATLLILMNVLVDIVYKWIDPRIKLH